MNSFNNHGAMVLGRGFFRRTSSFTYISRQGMTLLDFCLQLIPPGQGNQTRRRQPALAGLPSPRNKGGHRGTFDFSNFFELQTLLLKTLRHLAKKENSEIVSTFERFRNSHLIFKAHNLMTKIPFVLFMWDIYQ